jgi:gluconolactonase
MTLEFTKVATGLSFPEGPVAMKDGSLLFVEIEGQTLSRLEVDGSVNVVAKMPGGPNGAAIGPDGAAYVCNNGGVYDFVNIQEGVRIPAPGGPSANYRGGSIERVDLATGKVTTLYDSYGSSRLLTPDDIVVDKDRGGFWFTDSGIQHPESIQKGALYYGTFDQQPLKKVATIPTANGVGLSKDGNTIYVSDTIFGRLWALDIIGPGEVAKSMMADKPGKVVQTLPGFQWVDSLKVELGGRVCVGTIALEGGGITIFDPTDSSTEEIKIPDPFTTNLSFGGADMCDVWITASSTGTIYKTHWPRPGLELAYTA